MLKHAGMTLVAAVILEHSEELLLNALILRAQDDRIIERGVRVVELREYREG